MRHPDMIAALAGLESRGRCVTEAEAYRDEWKCLGLYPKEHHRHGSPAPASGAPVKPPPPGFAASDASPIPSPSASDKEGDGAGAGAGPPDFPPFTAQQRAFHEQLKKKVADKLGTRRPYGLPGQHTCVEHSPWLRPQLPDPPAPEYKAEYKKFLAPLLASEALSGVLLLDRHGMPAYEHGDLDHRAGTRLTQHCGRVKETLLIDDDERSLKYLFDIPVDAPNESPSIQCNTRRDYFFSKVGAPAQPLSSDLS